MDDEIEKPTKKKEKPLSPETKAYRLCVCSLCMILVTISIVGPLGAFTVVSCTSTDSCRIVGKLGLIGASCSEGSGAKSEYLMHGEKCTVVCSDGSLHPTVPQLTCNDGLTEGAESLRCVAPAPSGYSGPANGGLISGAITSGELRTACDRAKLLRCQGPPGSNAILLQWPDMTSAACQELMTKCRDLNSEFEYVQFVADVQSTTPPANEFVQVGPPEGVCTLGCYNERIEATNLPTLPPIVGPAYQGPPLQVGSNLCGGPPTAALPVCINIKGSCNAGDNGDYYRNQECVVGYPQWVQADNSHRIRFDGTPQYSQNGKWIIEKGIDPLSYSYGEYVARQNNFNNVPDWGTREWSIKCSQVVNVFTTYYTYKRLDLSLTECVCTRENDCSGHGRAEGSKLLGPACTCVCDSGYIGTRCETRLCKTPQIYRGGSPACKEGAWIYPNQICTPQCEAGYSPDRLKLTCNGNGTYFTPNYFECTGTGVVDYAAQAAAQFVGTTAPPPPCADVDCSFRGTPTGARRKDGSCVCDCMPNYVGNNCKTFSGDCQAPTGIENADIPACVQGTIFSTACTGQCLPGYWAVPATVQCLPGNTVYPKTFKCFGGEPVAKTWCAAMQGITIGASSMVFCVLLIICFYSTPVLKRKQKAFVIGETDAVELDKDEHGEYYVVRCAAKNETSKLPDRIKLKAINAPLQTGTYHLQDTSDEELRHNIMLEQVRQYEETLKHMQISDAPHDDLGNNAHTTVGSDTALRALANTVQGDTLATLGEADVESSEDLESQRGGDLVLGLPGYVPVEEPPAIQTQWLQEYIARDVEIQQKRFEDSKNAQSQNLSLEQKAAIEKANAIAKAIEDFADDRVKAEQAITAALSAGDGEALRVAVGTAKVVLAKLEGAPASVTSTLARLLKVGEPRLEQYTEKEDKRKGREAWLDRMRRGEAADWHMSVTEFWQHAELGNIAAVRAGLRAKLPVLNRSPDGQRLTVLHIACKRACTEAVQAVSKQTQDTQLDSDEVRNRSVVGVTETATSGNDIANDSVLEMKLPNIFQGGPEAGAGIGHGMATFEKGNESSKDAHQEVHKDPATKEVIDTDIPSASIEIENQRTAVVEALLNARAIPNATDSNDRTALDLAIFEGGPGSENLPIVQKLRALGLLTAKEAGAKARADAEAKVQEQAKQMLAKMGSQKRAHNFAGR